MSDSESAIQTRVLAYLKTLGGSRSRWWRNAQFSGFIEGRYIKSGLGPGSPDIVGIQSVVVTESMVGKKVGLFVALEVKDPNGKTGVKRLKDQRAWIYHVQELGGIGGFVESAKDAREVLREAEFCREIDEVI